MKKLLCTCTNCGTDIEASRIGQTLHCSGCGHTFKMPVCTKCNDTGIIKHYGSEGENDEYSQCYCSDF